VNEASLVDLFDSNYHFNQNLNRDFEVVALLEAATRLGQVDAEQVHHDEVLLHVLDVLVRVRHVLQTLEVL